MKLIMRRIVAIALFTLFLSACTTASVLLRPDIGSQSQAGVGDTIYIYRYEPSAPLNTSLTGPAYSGDNQPVMQEILYAGMANGRLVLDYREFFGDLARPSYSQTTQYDYAPGTPVSFKGASFTVIGADNQSIRYIVNRGFSNELRLEN